MISDETSALLQHTYISEGNEIKEMQIDNCGSNLRPIFIMACLRALAMSLLLALDEIFDIFENRSLLCYIH